MEPSRVFPKEIIQFTSEYYLGRYAHTSRIIYVVILVALVMLFASLPFVKVDVNARGSGVLRAGTGLSIIKAISPGLVKSVFVKENQRVEKGTLLFAVRSPILEEKINTARHRVDEIGIFIADLRGLISEQPPEWQPVTAFFRQSLMDYREKLAEKKILLAKASADHARNKKLYDQQVISTSEFEGFQFEVDRNKGQAELLRQSQLSFWQQEQRTYEKELFELNAQIAGTTNEIGALNIMAPVTGTIQNLAGIYPGSLVFANQDLAQISPDTGLVAEIYISPNDIGLLREGMETRMQVSAFNYNQWGVLVGKIAGISGDIQLTNDQPFFEIRCTLKREYLVLKNGYRGQLKKGMTVHAHFIVTQRSLWQLLYDKVDNWVNPNR